MTYITNGERWQITRGKINKVVKVGYTDLLADTELTYTNQLGVIVTAGDLYPTTDGNWFEVAAPGAVNQHITTAGGVKFYEAGPHFSSRSRAVAAWARMVARSETPPVGTVWTFDGVSIEYDGSTTAISDLSGWKPAGDVYADHFGENTTPGTTNMATAIQSAIDYLGGLGGGIANLRPETYRFDTGLTVSDNGVWLKGAGARATTLVCGQSSGDLLTINSAAQFVRVSDFMMEAASGVTVSNGIVIDGAYFPIIERIRCNDADITTHYNVKQNATNYDVVFRDVFSNVAATGMAIGRDGTGSVKNVVLKNVHLNAATVAGMDLVQVGGLIWDGGEALNCQRGLIVQPGDGETIKGAYISNVFFDTANNETLKIAPTHTGAKVTYIGFSQCGFNQSVVNHGISIVGPSSDNTVIERVRFYQCEGVINKQHGLNVEYAQLVEVSQSDFNGNSRGSSGTSHGVRVGPGVEKFTMIGGSASGTDDYPSDQGYGVFISGSATDVKIIGVNLADNQTGPIVGTPAGSFVVQNCNGCVTKARGTATITSGTSSVSVTHGMDIVPADKSLVQISLGNDLGNVGVTRMPWVTALNATTFTVNTHLNVSADYTFGWSAIAADQ